MSWDVLYLAACIALLFEGIPLFLAPKHMRASAANIQRLDDFSLRIVGLTTMLLGLGLLVLFNA